MSGKASIPHIQPSKSASRSNFDRLALIDSYDFGAGNFKVDLIINKVSMWTVYVFKDLRPNRVVFTKLVCRAINKFVK